MASMIAISTLFVVAIIIGARALGLESQYLNFLTWAQGSGFTGKFLTALLLLASVVFLLPSIYLTMGAGLLFGVVKGSLLVVVAETAGALVAYYLGHFAIINSLKQKLSRTKAFLTIDALVAKGGWELVATTRMVPFFPFKLSNYAFGLTAVRIRDFALGTFIGLWPIAIFNAYLGSIAGDVMAIGATNQQRSATEWGIYIAGFALVLVVLLITAKRASRRINAVSPSTAG